MEHPLPSPSPPRSPSVSDQQPDFQPTFSSNSTPEKQLINIQLHESQIQIDEHLQKQQPSPQSSPGSHQRSEQNSGRQASPNSRSSICHVRAAELFPKKALEADDASLTIPFTTICGEAVQYLSRTQDGILAMSNYRLFYKCGESAAVIVPLMLVESADVKDIFFLHIMCKDARSLRCTFATGEQCIEWQRRLEAALQPPASLEGLFAFCFRAWSAEPEGADVTKRLAGSLPSDPHKDFRKEVSRLGFDVNGAWRVSSANLEFKLCSSYPPLLLVPACVSDDALETVAKFRSSRRIPAVVWRHRTNGAVIARCSQPEVGWLGWRSNEDEQLLAALAAACHFDRGITTNTNRELAKKVLIVDARSYTSAVTNRARGGGCECPQYYPCAEIQFMNLPNIHSVRKSAQALRALAAEPADQPNWHSVLEKSLWLQSVGGLLKAADLVTRATHIAARPTLVHCSDGWDRTPQIVSLAELLLDPYYRTIDGFKVLVEREWLDFGHKFADRCGHTVGADDLNERCPVFLQWLDCVHQIQIQYPCSFEFSQAYLIKLAQHTYSCLFGTFLCNTRRERQSQRVAERTFSVWKFLNKTEYRNHLYEPNGVEVLFPNHTTRALVVWAAVYLGAAPDTPAPQPQPQMPHSEGTNESNQEDQEAHVSDTNSSESLETNGRIRNESLTWRSISECSQQTDSSSGCIDLGAELNNSGVSPSAENSTSKRRQRLDSVQNGGLNDSAAILLETEIGNLLSAEANRISEQQQQQQSGSSPTFVSAYNSQPAVHRRQRSDGGRQSAENAPTHCPACSNNGEEHCSEMTLCPNSPLRAFRTYSAGANTMSKWHGRSGSFPAASNQSQSPQQLPPVLDSCGICCCTCCGSLTQSTKETGCKRPQRTSNGGITSKIDKWGSTLDPVDGLVCPQSPVQHRLQQIIRDHLMREELLMRELHAARVELLQRACRTSRMTPDHSDDNSDEGSEALDMSQACKWTNEQIAIEDAYVQQHLIRRPLHHSSAYWDLNPPAEPIVKNCREPGPSNGESSAMQSRGTSSSSGGGTSSNAAMKEGGVLWVPDHAVSRCTRCQTHFWLGKRKHHCRNCGKIFCAECSENTTPIPNEQLYNPVRVCADCFASLVKSQPYEERSYSIDALSNRSMPHMSEFRRIPQSSNNSSSSNGGLSACGGLSSHNNSPSSDSINGGFSDNG